MPRRPDAYRKRTAAIWQHRYAQIGFAGARVPCDKTANRKERTMALLDSVDPQGLEEFSVVFTDRSLNSMS
ncbi:MAG: hypothetical protein WBA67_07970, partial [Jannaschia sp.]